MNTQMNASRVVPRPDVPPGMAPLGAAPTQLTPLVYVPQPYRVPVPAANSAINDIRYGLRSPNFGLRVEAVEKLVDLLPQQLLSEENAFVDALRAKKDSPVVADALKDAIDFLSLVVTSGDTHLLLNVEKTATIAKYFNALGRVVENGHLLGDIDEERQAEIEALKNEIREIAEQLTDYNDSQKEMEAAVKKLEEAKAELASRLEESEERCQVLKDKETELTEMVGEIARETNVAVREMESELSMQKETLKTMKIEIQEAESRQKRDSEEKEDLEEEVDELRKTVEKQEETLSLAYRNINKLEERNADSEERVIELEKIASGASDAVSKLKSDLARAEMNLSAKEAEVAELKKEFEKSRVKSRREAAVAEERLKELEDIACKVGEKLKQKVMALESELSQKTAENDALRADEVKSAQELDRLKFQLEKTEEALLAELEKDERSEDEEFEREIYELHEELLKKDAEISELRAQLDKTPEGYVKEPTNLNELLKLVNTYTALYKQRI
ncbi:hypothetical protein QR680_008015 [Steinernema hermaphroditum]|uniref:Uncharacterized protein n=1 Tax=Steinernema hermaphroditum TaxID=289476 RepID=A0AA39M694_9BILA|nr:hypothetical protein QR680_008015 [Steinernema hermaphroditum]